MDTVKIDSIQEMNYDGVNDLVAYDNDSLVGGSTWDNIHICSWQGGALKDDSMSVFLMDNYPIEDTNGNGTKELILASRDSASTYKCEDCEFFWRKETDHWTWNGKAYNLTVEYALPIYRFQAIRGGERE